MGYNTVDLQNNIGTILGLYKKWNVALIGIGNIGRALIDYQEFKEQGFIMKLLLDNDEDKQNKLHALIPTIRKYFNCQSISGIKNPNVSKRPYLSIIKNIIKLKYQLSSKGYRIIRNKTHIRTTQHCLIQNN